MSGNQRSVLIIDDDETDRFVLKRLLRGADTDWHCFEVSHGGEALAFFGDFEANKRRYGDLFPPTLALLDINMPVMNGFEFLAAFAKLKDARPEVHTSVVVLLTSSASTLEREQAVDRPFVQAFLLKDELTAEQLQRTVESARVQRPRSYA
ncbi:MAG: response regulator [Pseudomonadota bacterium]